MDNGRRSARHTRVPVLDDVRTFPRYVTGLAKFLQPVTPEECRRRVGRQLERRAETFVEVLARAVYPSEQSAYRRLLEHAGIELGDVTRMVQERGVEDTLSVLHDAGVYISLEEFRGRRPVQRPGLELELGPSAFDNPVARTEFTGRSGGSRSPGRLVLGNFETAEYQVSHHGLLLLAFGLTGRPTLVWFPGPPSMSGLFMALFTVKFREQLDHWFVPSKRRPGLGSIKPALLTTTAWSVAKAVGAPFPWPRHVPPGEALRVARWLERQRRAGTPGIVTSTPSCAVRVCVEAREHGLDIAGSTFELGSEPFTPGKAEIVAAAGCNAASMYGMTEVGYVGLPCPDPAWPDEVHLLTDRLAVSQRPRQLTPGVTVDALHYTTLMLDGPRIVINVESDDFGVVEERSCGCELDQLGFNLHLHTIRSFEKLTSEGTSFLGERLVALVDEVLPARFGGKATDYQLVESERDGVPRIEVVVSPRIGAIEEEDVGKAILAFLRHQGGAHEVMADTWQASETLEVVRREPLMTSGGKIQPLHVLERQRSTAST